MKYKKSKSRKLEFQVNLSKSKGLLICIPDSPLEKSIAEKIRAEACPYCYVNILPDASPEEIVSAKKPVILLGNLSNNAVVEELYYRFLAATDLWYPGPAGYEIRMLLDPYGNGQNIIHIGYSDDEGLGKAAHEFIPRIDQVIDYISEVHATRLHITKSEEMQIRTIKAPELKWMNIARDVYKKGYLGYLTGDMGLIDAYCDMWRAIVSYQITKEDQKIKDLHLKMSNLIQSFRLVETVGLITDKKLHADITKYIVDWPNTDQGLIRINKPDYMHPEFPRQNHGMIPALGLAFLIDYCKTYSFDIKNLNEWEALVEKAYHPYMNGSWKPVCDGTCHGWWLSQPALLEYGLIEPKHRYFRNGGAKKAADAALSLINNNGVMPSSGDYNLLRAFPGASLRHAMAYYSDGRYKFAHDMAPEYLSSKYHVYMPRMFDTGLLPVIPQDQIGITVTQMDPLIYNSWDNAPGLVREMLYSGPDVPIERTFDKLAIRTGWKKEDQYMLIDGLGSNSNHTHSYPDALGIIDYYHMGESWIIAENGSKFPEPENNTILTIVRKGEEFTIPSFGELLSAEKTENSYYAAMRLNNYSSTNWTREINLIRDVGVVITDTVDILEDGEYGISTHIRTPGKVSLKSNTMSSVRVVDEVDKKFFVQAYCSENFKAGTRENDFSLTYRNHKGEPSPRVEEEDIEFEWQKRYHTKDRVVSSLDSRVDRFCKAGEKIVFAHFAYAFIKGQAPPKILLSRSENEVVSSDKCHNLKLLQKIDMNRVPEELATYSGVVTNNDVKLELGKVLKDKIHCVDTIKQGSETWYYAGHGNNSMSCLNSEFQILWTRIIERDPTYCYWWELDYPSVVEIKAFSHNDKDYIVAGCGDLLVRCFSSQGDERWRFQYINGVPGRINIFDSDGDGVPEILVGGEVISNRSQCRVLGIDGKLKYELDAEFWTSRLTSYADIAVGNERYVALGANHGRNLHLYRTFSNGDSKPVKMFEKKLAGTITDINIDTAKQSITAVSTEGFSVTYDFYGNKMDQSSVG